MVQCGITGAIPLHAVHHAEVPVRTAFDSRAIKPVIAAFNDPARCRIAHSFGETERANLFETDLGPSACGEEEHEAGSDRICAPADQTRQRGCCWAGAAIPASVCGPASHREHESARGHPGDG